MSQITLFKNTNMNGRVQDGMKLFASVKERKLHVTKITLYKVSVQLSILSNVINYLTNVIKYNSI